MCEHARGNEALVAQQGNFLHYRAYTTFRTLFGELQRRIKPREEHTMAHIAEIASVLEDAQLDVKEWSQFTNWSEAKYTRSLVAHDPHFTVLLLCWNRGQRSPIHDHAGSSCWVKVLDGAIRERRFRVTEAGPLENISDVSVPVGGVCYINDSQSLHDMGTVGPDATCVSMHVYCPPFYYCSAFALDGAKRQVSMLAATAPRRDCIPESCNIRGCTHDGEGHKADDRASPSGTITIRELCETLDLTTSTKEHCAAAFSKTFMSSDDWRSFAHFNDSRFQRLLLHENPRYSLLMLCWLKDQKTPKHDHMGSESWVKVLAGALSLTTFTATDVAGQEIEQTSVLNPESTSDGFHEGPQLPFHVVQCTSDFAVSLHLYSPPYTDCHYDAPVAADGSQEQRSLPSVCCQRTARIPNLQALSEQLDKIFTCPCTCCGPAQHAEHIMDILAGFNISLREVDKFYNQRRSHGYTIRLAETPTHNLILNLWDPAATTVAHDHDGSSAFLMCLTGVVHDTAYETPQGGGQLRVTRTSRLSRGQVCYYSDASIHAVRNHSKEHYAATLHVYHKVCRAANWYSLAVDAKPMRVTGERGRSPTRHPMDSASTSMGNTPNPVGGFSNSITAANLSNSPPQ